MIRLRNVTYSYAQELPPVLRGLNLEIADGDLVLVVGASGAGKSTFLRCLNGLVPHFYGGVISGEIRVAHMDPIAAEPRAMSQAVGFVFQDPEAQFVVDTVEAELAFAMENHNLPQATMRKRVEEVLDQLNIAHLRNRRISTLSGGEKQRVAIASVLTLQPQVLVLDEPTSQLDPQAAEEVLTALQKLNADLGLTIVLSEHRLERVVQYADRMIYFPGEGQTPIEGAPEQVLHEIELAPALDSVGQSASLGAVAPDPQGRATPRRRPYPDPSLPERGPRRTSSRDAPVEIAIEDLWHSYDDQWALRGVSLEIRRGELVALMGRNGAGKTTLLKHLVGLLQPARGRVQVRQMDTRQTAVEDLTRLVGYVPQNPNALLFADTVREEIAFTRKSHGLPERDPSELLAALGLQGLAEAYPRDLSVGERQRVALAAILAAEPEILLLDEPTRGVDYAQKEALAAYLAAAQAQGRTVVLSTHDVELAASSVDRVIILGDGEIVVDGPTRQVMSQSMVFASQINKLFRSERYLTVQDVLESLP